MTTGPENPYGEQDPGTPPTHQPYGQQPPPPNPYQQQQPYQQPYQQAPYGQQPYPPQQPYGYAPHGYPVSTPTDGLALGAMITGIAALVMACAYGVGLLASPVALVLGRVSMKRIDRSEGQLGGRGYAVAGFVLGIIGTVLLVLAIAAVIALIVFAAGDDSSTLGS
jgi:hypothetical protein